MNCNVLPTPKTVVLKNGFFETQRKINTDNNEWLIHLSAFCEGFKKINKKHCINTVLFYFSLLFITIACEPRASYRLWHSSFSYFSTAPVPGLQNQ